MTTIVYRDGVLAADTRGEHGGWISPTRFSKITRLDDGRLVAISGNYNYWTKFLTWLLDPIKDQPDLKEEATAIVITPNGEVRRYEQTSYHVVDAPFVALGSGAPPALGALHAGATALEAVRIAGLVDPYTGTDIESLRLQSHPI